MNHTTTSSTSKASRTSKTPKLSRTMAALAAGLTVSAFFGAAFATMRATGASEASEASSADGKAGRAVTAPYVLNPYGEEHADTGNPERRPTSLVLSEFTQIGNVKWKQWDAKQASGTGDVGGAWCLPDCLDKPLKGTVTLSDPKTVNGKTYYSAFTLKLSGNPGTYESEDLRGKHALATP